MTDIELTSKIINCAMQVHKALGPGLLENVYHECLVFKLEQSGLKVEREKHIPVIFENKKMKCTYRVDVLVEDRIVLELKSVEALCDVHKAQLLSYLKLGGFRPGLLINFNTVSLTTGIKRVINGY